MRTWVKWIVGGLAFSSSFSPVAQTQPPTWWKPTADAPISWHLQLSQDFEVPRDTRPNVYVYEFDGEQTTAATVKALKDWGTRQGKAVVALCYIDVGVYETYRSDIKRFAEAQNELRKRSGNPKARLWGNADVGWEGSFWLDVRQTDLLLPIMEDRIKNWCKDKGFDAIDPDETEVWSNNPGFSITRDQSHSYTRAIAALAHKYGLSVGLKGNNAEAALLEPYHDWAVTEQCFTYQECQNFVDSFIKHNKAVFNLEYATPPDCTFANQHRINSAQRDLNLVGPTAPGYLYRPCVPDGSPHWP